MELKTAKLRIVIDEKTGYTSGLFGADGENWVLEHSDWGHVQGVEGTAELEQLTDGVRAIYSHESRPLRAVVTKQACAEGYRETYEVFNDGAIEYFLREGDFGVHFPLNSPVHRGTDFLHRAVNAHPWCGGNVAYINALRVDGEGDWLSIYMEEGDVCFYDIWRDMNRTPQGVDYRGDLVFCPHPQPILPGQALKLQFLIRPERGERRTALAAHPGHIELSASSFSPETGEHVQLQAAFSGEIRSARVLLEEEELAFRQDGNVIFWEQAFSTPGERKFFVEINGKRTWMRINVLPPLPELLAARARFIAKHQQYLREGSPLDGALLIYDRATDSQYCDEQFYDHNAGRERVAMGLVLIRALRLKRDPLCEKALERYVRFVRRELVDSQTGEVFNEIRRKNTWLRIYNFPWFASFFLELYELNGNRDDLLLSAAIMRRYYALGGAEQDSQCIPMMEMVQALEAANLPGQAEALRGLFEGHAQSILARNMASPSIEMGYAPEMSQTAAAYLAQVYLMSGNAALLELMHREKTSAESFFDWQPDCHMNGMGLRHWDGYWFGKRMQYGDLYPQHWNVLAGEMYYFLARVEQKPQDMELARAIYRNNLCVFLPDGFASSGYLYPRRITQYAAEPEKLNPSMTTGTAYGQRLDDWANDQDWALYYAAKRLIEEAQA